MSIQQFSLESNNVIFPDINAWFDQQSDSLCFSGCTGSYDAFLTCNIFTSGNRSVLTLVPDSKYAELLARECASLIGEEHIAHFPSRDAIPYNMKSPFGPTVETRFSVLSQLMNGKKQIYITPAVTLMQKILPQKELFNHTIKLRTNDEISQEKLSSWLIENGFTRETLVQDIGTFAIRGGIVDIYPFLTENPVRLEFWGDTIESIREFDIFKQNSIKPCSSVDIFPMKEFCLTDEQIEQGLTKIERYCIQNNEDLNSVYKLKQKWMSQADHDGIEWFLHWFELPYATILDYLPADCCVIWNDVFHPARRLDENYNNYTLHLNRVPDTFLPLVSKPDALLVPIQQINEDLSTYNRVFINTDTIPENAILHKLSLQVQPSFNGNLNLLTADLVSKDANGYSINILCENIGHAERLKELLENECPAVTVSIGYIKNGFVDPENKIAIYSESQIFNRIYRTIRTKKSKASIPISGFDALLPGDFVVHIDHGIARFSGIERIQTTGIHQDCMVLEYQDKAKVYVPIEDFHKVQKYIGKGSSQPTLSKLGTARWEKQKARARQSLREMAENLIKLYAKREYLEGIKFSKDSVWQKEFEDSFIYEATPDQDSAIKDIKTDMESFKSMDRLVCGDVGFGKTEVAMRAAFKAAIDGYQVALLAPTTILAAQHFTTFTERMANFPISIAVLSRFQKIKEQKAILKKLITGTIDIVIGTQRILSKDVEFKNLGLLIVDEEQHFGVRHKEKLKEYRYKVDVLSMTATPIPRTMHMSLIGIRDLSIINTPPINRLPIETHVSEYYDEIIKNAIENELDRGGQVYIVHNRIKNLPQLQDTIELAVPRARIMVAHGQMDEKKLELVMKEFVAGKFDVLLSTAIIESGLDIPNVNTIIVTRADALGLSQLYQLRGRVGRSSEQAYAYFLTNSFQKIKEVSLKRLRALEQYTDLGSGFQIAMRDLEIRGAGNILGTHQHGFIAAVGFELYCRLLKEEVDNLMGREPKEKEREVKIDLPINAYIPADYVADSSTRISLYQECSACKEINEIDEMEKNLVDRFGPLPETAQAFLILMHIKVLGQNIGLSHISSGADNFLSISLHGNEDEVAQRLKRILSASKQQFEVIYGTPLVLKTALTSKAAIHKSSEIKNILESLTNNIISKST